MFQHRLVISGVLVAGFLLSATIEARTKVPPPRTFGVRTLLSVDGASMKLRAATAKYRAETRIFFRLPKQGDWDAFRPNNGVADVPSRLNAKKTHQIFAVPGGNGPSSRVHFRSAQSGELIRLNVELAR